MTALYYPLTENNGENLEMPQENEELVFRRSDVERAQDNRHFGTETVRYGTVVQHMHTINENIFGHLATKMKVLAQNMRAKRTQLILTMHPYRENVIILKTDGPDQRINLHECEYPRNLRWYQERQLLWCRHLRNLNISGDSFRYLRLDTRLGNRYSREAVSLADITNLQFYAHGPYIYLETPLAHKYIMYNGVTYAWMRSEYVMLHYHHNTLIGTSENVDTDTVRLFLTCFDTRTYSSFRVHTVDSEHMSDEIYAMDANDLDQQGFRMQDTRRAARMNQWRSSGNCLAAFKWIWHNGGNQYETQLKSSLGDQHIESHYMLNITTDDANLPRYLSRFYSLPDVLRNHTIAVADLRNNPLCETVDRMPEAVNSSFRTQIANGNNYQKVRAWNILHGDNKEVEVSEAPDADHQNMLNSSIEYIQNETVRDMLREIEEVLRPRSSENMH